MGGVKVYETALTCALNDDLKEEWEKYLEQTKRHVTTVETLMQALDVPSLDTPGTPGRPTHRRVTRCGHEAGERSAPPEAAEIVACECVVHAEAKDHANWELLSTYGQSAKGDEKKAIDAAVEETEDEEDEHLYHSKGWCRELSIASLGMKAVLPPPRAERREDRIGAARAKQTRKDLM